MIARRRRLVPQALFTNLAVDEGNRRSPVVVDGVHSDLGPAVARPVSLALTRREPLLQRRVGVDAVAVALQQRSVPVLLVQEQLRTT